MRQTVIAFLATVVVAVGGQPAHAQESPIVTTKISEFNGLIFDDPFSLTLTAISGAPPYRWSIEPGGALPAGLSLTPQGVISGTPSAGGPAHFTVRARDIYGMSGTKAFIVSVYPVPKPDPINIPYTLSTIYMPKPSWPSWTWGELRMNNERNGVKATKGQRMPLLGYYQGDNPQVLDWQIKMAVDRGITNFVFDDYWVDNVAHPIAQTSSQAFLASRYRGYMSFAMLYNYCQTPGNSVVSEVRACFFDKVLPFYVSQYFSQPNYLKIDGRPVIQFLHVGLATGLFNPTDIWNFLHDPNNGADHRIAELSGGVYPGAYWIATETIGAPYTAGGTIDFTNVSHAGFNAVAPYYVLPYLWPDIIDPWLYGFPLDITCPQPNPYCNQTGNYNWPIGQPYDSPSPPPLDVVASSINRHTRAFEAAAAASPPLKFITSIATDFDSRSKFFAAKHLYFNGHTDVSYWNLLVAVKGQIDWNLGLVPVSSNTSKPLVGLGAWNEQSESSSVEPGYSEFQWGGVNNAWFVASAAANVFGGPWTYDEYTPPDLGRGFPIKSDWTFSTATGAGLDEWSAVASAGLAIGPDDVLEVTSAGLVNLNTPTYVDAGLYNKVKVLVRVDEGATCLGELELLTENSDYSETAHEFGEPQEPGHQFFGPGICLAPVPASGFHEYTFDLTSHPLWAGTVKFLELRFKTTPDCLFPLPPPPCSPGPPGSPNRLSHMRYSVKRVWMEQ